MTASGPRHHAVIAGTGRAGTTFLVQWLTACGLDTDTESVAFSSRARAGFEHRLGPDETLPYVVKDPWLFTYCDRVDLDAIAIDALIVPIRKLADAATSRVRQERIALLDRFEDMAEDPIDVTGATPGGVLYSLSVLDQERLLAVGFHHLLHWAVSHELPLFLLDFPRLVRDRDYALGTLWPWLSNHCTEPAARQAFDETVAPDAVRVGAERGAGTPEDPISRAAALDYVAELRLGLERQRTDEEARLAAVNEELRQAREVAHLAQERMASIESSRGWRWLTRARSVRHRLGRR